MRGDHNNSFAGKKSSLQDAIVCRQSSDWKKVQSEASEKGRMDCGAEETTQFITC